MEVHVPEKFDQENIREIDIRKVYNLLVLTTIANTEIKSAVGKTRNITKVKGVAGADDILYKDDILVIYGSNKDIKRFLNEY